MSVVQTLIGNIKGPQGDQGPTGATGATGTAATITVGTTTTTAYGNAAQVTNTGTQSAAVLNFVIPQGRPGQQTTTMGDLTLDSITTSMEDFPSPAINDTGKVVFGKIVKFFSDTLSRFAKHAENVATISSSPTTQAFSAGDFLVYNDQLYKVTANIANGGTLTPGTNISSTSTGEQLTSLNDSLLWILLEAKTGKNNPVTIPTTWHEANIRFALGGTRFYMFHVVKPNFNFASSSVYSIRTGYYVDAGNHSYVSIDLVTHTDGSAAVSIGNAYLSGSDLGSTSTIQVVYR